MIEISGWKKDYNIKCMGTPMMMMMIMMMMVFGVNK
jgi:hypothetical protein